MLSIYDISPPPPVLDTMLSFFESCRIVAGTAHHLSWIYMYVLHCASYQFCIDFPSPLLSSIIYTLQYQGA